MHLRMQLLIHSRALGGNVCLDEFLGSALRYLCYRDTSLHSRMYPRQGLHIVASQRSQSARPG